MFAPPAQWAPPRLEELPAWAEARRIGIDVETCDPTLTSELGGGPLRGGYLVGVSCALEDGPSFYLPIRHAGGGNLPEEGVLRYLREQARTFRGAVCGANLSYDLNYLWDAGVDFASEATYRDVQIADPLLCELHNSYSLQNIALRHGLAGKDEELLREAASTYGVDPKSELWKLPACYVGPYATQDAVLPLQVLRRQERLIDEQDLWEIWNLESQVLPALLRMRRRGVLVDFDRLAAIEQWAEEEEAAALGRVRHLTGVAIAVGDVWKPEVLAPALEAVGLVLRTTATGKPNIDKELFASLDHPVGEHLARARKVNKLRTTFAASVRRHAINGRIHCTFMQIAREDEGGQVRGARYGRLSCVRPNLQQQPSRDEFAKRWRSIYRPEPGSLWAACDYSQQEPRWTTHFAAACGLPKAEEAARAYRENPQLDNHQFMAELTGLPRRPAKDIYLGLCYGEGGAKLCRQLGLPTRWAVALGRGGERRLLFAPTREEAFKLRAEHQDGFVYETAGMEGQEILDKFDNRAPFIRLLARKAQRTAAARGYIVTGGRRRLRFPQQQDGSYDWTHKALNRLIQGTSADQTKHALVALDRAGFYTQLQVHDEVDSSVMDRTEAERIGEVMRDVMPARVPFLVDVELGPSWGEAK